MQPSDFVCRTAFGCKGPRPREPLPCYSLPGKLDHHRCGGSNGSISERTPDGKEWHVGGAVTEEEARAIVAAVNFVRDLCSRGEAT